MTDQGKAPGRAVRRRDAFGLAGAVAAFSAALGMSTSGAKAQGKTSYNPHANDGGITRNNGSQQQQKVQTNQYKLNNTTGQTNQYKLNNTTGQTNQYKLNNTTGQTNQYKLNNTTGQTNQYKLNNTTGQTNQFKLNNTTGQTAR